MHRLRKRPDDDVDDQASDWSDQSDCDDSPRAPKKFRRLDEPTQIAILYERLNQPRNSRGQRVGTKALMQKFHVSAAFLRRLEDRARHVQERGRLSDLPRSGRPSVATPTKLKALGAILEAEGYDLSYREMERRLQNIGNSSKGISKTRLQVMLSSDQWRMTRHWTRPLLTAQHVALRLSWAKDHLQDTWTQHVDLDEKWFYGDSLSGRLHVPRGVRAPRRRYVNKRFIPKVMIITAIAKPDPLHSFDGKVGFWPVCEAYEARANSKYHAKGDRCIRPVTPNTPRFRALVKAQILRQIRRKMRWATEITLQMDNAPAHSKIDQTVAASHTKHHRPRVPVRVVKQPPQSPDTNANDIGLYHSLQRSIDKSPLKLTTPQHILFAFRRAWAALEPLTIEKISRAKSNLVRAIVAYNGTNEFVVPHSRDVA